ncbi:DsbA family protein [Tropicibacter naphthalenivorans]|uniref:Thiol-disulfide oxidoreductase D n=1 Tax=Tropicibacter naphthalenivorans TaxID=441103 RepID=A0A0P1GRY7_9RHOB|nr:DsbA family protein [Tropicibacter naphthalenivorans]CUH78450.1 Thiol-disulfide oxidoreductase D [Tropicibacter naphthalenivorans]SMC80518.1 Thioredoxin [Tropicibacter naphthalenivorans]
MKMTSTAGALALAVIAGGAWFYGQEQGQVAGPEFTLPMAANAQEASAPAAEEAEEYVVQDMVLGAEDAPVTVIEYASYTCPHCATFHENVFKDVKANYIDTGKVKFVYREVYFDKFGMWGSMIARCGDDTNRFFGITDMLFKTQGTWARAGSEAAIADELRKVGRLAGLGNEQLDACLTDGGKLRALVGWYKENAEEHGIDSTPSFIINGEKVSNMNYADFSAYLDEQLAAAE